MKPGVNSRAPLGVAKEPPRTVCKICDCSIYIGDDKVAWVVSPRPGLAHEVCAQEAPPRT